MISIDYQTLVIFIPQADLTPIAGSQYGLDLNDLHLWLRDWEDDAIGMHFPTTHNHVAPLVVAGITIARVMEIINGYTIEFEDGSYQVILTGGNHNVSDVLVQNNVSLITNLSAGLIETGVSGLTVQEGLDLAMVRKIMQNKMVTDPVTGKQTVYEDDGVAVFVEGDLFEDAAGTQTYQGKGAERRERLE